MKIWKKSCWKIKKYGKYIHNVFRQMKMGKFPIAYNSEDKVSSSLSCRQIIVFHSLSLLTLLKLSVGSATQKLEKMIKRHLILLHSICKSSLRVSNRLLGHSLSQLTTFKLCNSRPAVKCEALSKLINIKFKIIIINY